MIPLLYAFLLGGASFVDAYPLIDPRTVTSLDQAAFAEAQKRDDTATRAFSSVPIKTSDGKCLFVDELSGDFRANLTPIQIADCDGSDGQSWDVITAGVHNDQPNSMLIVSTLTQACFNFDPRRAAGNQVLLFSCGGRADGGGSVTNSQLFPFSGGAGPLAFTPENAAGSCLTVSGSVIDIATCNTADPNQSFTFGDASASASASAPAVTEVATSVAPASSAESCSGPDPATSTMFVTVTVTSSDTSASSDEAVVTTAPAPATTTTSSTSAASVSSNVAVVTSAPTTAPTTATTGSATVISVSRAGVVLDPSAAAEANPRDDTATRAFSSVAIKSSSGQCLFIDPTAGDFRENLIPIVLQDCDGSANQQWDFITSGVHNNQPNSTLIVSSLTQGCLNFDPRRAAGDTVIMFSCGGRADGGGSVTNSQLFNFVGGETSLQIQPENGNGQVCFAANAQGRLDQATCSDDPAQIFTIG